MSVFNFSTLDLNDFEIADKLQGDDWIKVLHELAAILFTQRTFAFESESSNDGPWPPLSDKVRKRRARGSKQGQSLAGGGTADVRMLRDQGILFQSFTPATGPGDAFQDTDITARTVEIITSVVYAAIHNFGGTIKIPAHEVDVPENQDGFGRGILIPAHTRKVPAHSFEMPARPFDHFTDDDIEEIREFLESFLNG